MTADSSLTSPPDAGLQRQNWEGLVSEKLCLLRSRLAGDFWPLWKIENPNSSDFTLEDWRNLAILLAIKHKELGFELPALPKGRRAFDDEIARDDLMFKYIYGTKTHCNREARLRIDENARKMTDTHASKKVFKHLTDLARVGAYMGKIPSAEAIRSQWSKRVNEAKTAGIHVMDRLPSHIKQFTKRKHLIEAIWSVAAALTIPSDNGRLVKEPDEDAPSPWETRSGVERGEAEDDHANWIKHTRQA